MSEEIFKKIYTKLQLISNESKVMAKQQNLNKKWAYSVCGTPIRKNAAVIMGINWGGGRFDEEFAPQQKMPTQEEFMKGLKNGSYDFLKKASPYLTRYANIDINKDEFNYTNLCFFRSPSSNDLSFKDYELSIPIFKDLITEIQPSKIVCLGTSVYTYLRLCFDEIHKVEAGNKVKFKGYDGKLWKFPFYCVPHPNARVSNIVREEVWKKVFQ